MARRRRLARGYSLLELLALAAVLAVAVRLILPRLATSKAGANKAACQANVGHIEIQAELWRHNTGAWPAANLSDIAASLSYFPSGLPACPVTGAPYTIDSTGRVQGHAH